MRRKLALVLGVLALCVVVGPVAADDMPTMGAASWSSAVLGAEGWYAGALPPPGMYLLNYTLYYSAHELKGEHGGHVSALPLTDFEARVVADVIRPLYVSDKTILGANPAWHMCIPVLTMRQKTDYWSDVTEGLGDVYVSPLILGWHNPPWHYVAALDVITPTGHYSRGITTVGHNHWTFEPAFAISYIGESGFSASTKLMYDIHTEDHRADYKEGQQFHLDYNVGYSLGEKGQWRVGLCGYFLQSMEEDKLNGHRIDGSEEGVAAIGPTVSYQAGKLNVEVKVQREFDAENRPEGTAAWLKLIYPL